MYHLAVLAQMKSIEPLLALPSLSTFEPEHDYESYRVTTSSTDPQTRHLYLAEQEEHPILEARTDDQEVITIRCLDVESLPHDLQMALIAIGANKGAAWSLQIDSEDYLHRTSAIDAAYTLMQRLRRLGVAPAEVQSLASQILQAACGFREVRQLVFDSNQSGQQRKSLDRRLDVYVDACKTIVQSSRLPGLQGITMNEEPRGSAIGLVIEGTSDPIEVLGHAFNWNCTVDRPSLAPIGKGPYAIRPTRVSDSVMAALQSADIRGEHLHLTAQLSKKEYAEVNQLLNEVGGTWCAGRQAHVFESDARSRLAELLRTGQIFTRKDFEFFWTPPSLAAKMVERAKLRPGMKVLEPQAGQGGIALPLAEAVGVDNVTCYEIMPDNVRHLQAKGFSIAGPADFLSITPVPTYSAVLLNPPFSGGRDIAHVTHALKFLEPGGVLVAITSTRWRSKDDRKSLAFRTMLQAIGAQIEDVASGAFADSGTSVATLMITVRTPAPPSERRDPAQAAVRPVATAPSAVTCEEAQLALF